MWENPKTGVSISYDRTKKEFKVYKNKGKKIKIFKDKEDAVKFSDNAKYFD